jgi:FAD/FMN-containing dehydrogenase
VLQVKSGGHSQNPGFSSTEGIQIYTGKFSQVTYDAISGTVVIGTGLVWDSVYQQLQEHNVIVLGGRFTGVSGCDPHSWRNLNHIMNRLALVASYSAEVGLWGLSAFLYVDASPIGYSYKTNQHGLAIDTIVGYNLVLPNGTVACVTESTHPDLFFGLKGGFNNFVSLPSNIIGGRCTYRVTGDRNRFHDDRVPADGSVGTDGPLCNCPPAGR